jgi:hypothetical protein
MGTRDTKHSLALESPGSKGALLALARARNMDGEPTLILDSTNLDDVGGQVHPMASYYVWNMVLRFEPVRFDLASHEYGDAELLRPVASRRLETETRAHDIREGVQTSVRCLTGALKPAVSSMLFHPIKGLALRRVPRS